MTEASLHDVATVFVVAVALGDFVWDQWVFINVLISSGKVKSYLWNNNATTIFVSNNAKCCPKQFRGPAINGKNVYGSMFFQVREHVGESGSLVSPFEGSTSRNRYGSYCIGCGHIFGSKCTAWILIKTVLPLGKKYGGSSTDGTKLAFVAESTWCCGGGKYKSWTTRRAAIGTTLYLRNVSFKHASVNIKCCNDDDDDDDDPTLWEWWDGKSCSVVVRQSRLGSNTWFASNRIFSNNVVVVFAVVVSRVVRPWSVSVWNSWSTTNSWSSNNS